MTVGSQESDPATEASLLHLHLGITKYLIDRLKDKWEEVDDWLEEIGIPRNEFGKFDLNGNHCKTILDCADQLWTKSQTCLKYEVQSLVEALRAFGRVVHSCFGNTLEEGWETQIQGFQKAWEGLADYYDSFFPEDPKISYTEKVHVLIFHVPQFCKKYPTGLGVFSEQAGESLHGRFRKHRENYDNAPKHMVGEDPDLWATADFNAKQL